jgi:transcriptional regulator with XRE-family HTH domain
MITIGSLMAQSRNKRKLTQLEAADLLHTSDRTIAGYERNEYNMPVDVIVSAAKAYNDKGLLLAALSLNPIWKAALPSLDIEGLTLAGAAANTGACLSDIYNHLSDILRILCDSKVSQNEKAIYQPIKKLLLKLLQASMEWLALDGEFDTDIIAEIEAEREEMKRDNQ